MSKLFLDLKKFKKLKSDIKTTTFQHADGHTITVAHTKLTDKMRKELDCLPTGKDEKPMKAKKMADGGDIEPTPASGNSDPGYLDYLKYLGQKAIANVGNSGQMISDQTHLAQQQLHNPNLQPTAAQQANQDKYFQSIAGGVTGSMTPVKGAALAGELATPERAALNEAYNNIPKGYAPEAAENIVRKADVNSRAMDFAQRTKDQLKARRGYAEGGEVQDRPCLNPNCKSHGQPHPNCKCYGYAEGGRISSGGCQCCLDGIQDNDLIKQSGQKRMADGGNVAETAQDSPDQIAQDAQAPATAAPIAQQVNPVPAQPNRYANIYDQTYAAQKVNNPGQPDQMVRDTALDTAYAAKKSDEIKQQVQLADQEQQAAHSIEEDQKRAALGLPAMGGGAQPAQDQSNPQDSGPANQPSQQSGSPQDSFMGNMQKAYGLQNQGIEQGAQAQSQLGQEASAIRGLQSQADQENLVKMQQIQQQAMSEYDGLMKDVQNGYIDPHRFMNGMGTPQKVGTAIGLILGGIGGGLTGQENPAMKFLNSQIERDIEAQKVNLGAKNNLLAHNIQHLNSVQDGFRLTQAQMNSMYAHQIDQAAANAMTPQAKAAALQAKGELLAKSAMFLGQIGGPGQGAQGNPMDNYLNTMRLINPERAKEVETRYVPGMGIASVPLSEDARKTLIGKAQLADASKDMYEWASKHSGSLNPADINIGKTKAANLQNMYRGAMNGGVYKKGEQEFIDNIVDSDPTKFFNSVRVLPKLREVMNQNQISANGIKRSYGMVGLPGQSSTPGNQSFQPKSFKPVK